MTRGDIVARIADPCIPAGSSASIRTRGLVSIGRFGVREVLEFAIPEAITPPLAAPGRAAWALAKGSDAG
jgi:hypothetical protein